MRLCTSAGREGQGIFVLLFTTLNTVGRMAGGYIPERLLHTYGTPRSAGPAPLRQHVSCRSKPSVSWCLLLPPDCPSSTGPLLGMMLVHDIHYPPLPGKMHVDEIVLRHWA